MFFILSKILYFLLVPFYWIIILLIWRWFSKNQALKKRLLILAILFLVVFTNPCIYNMSNLAWQSKPINLSTDKKYEAGILLGGMAGYDKNNRGYFGDNADRFIQTANLYHQRIIKKIIVSGGTGSLNQEEPAEAFFLRAQFIANGVNDSDILIESRSRNTYENAIYSKKIIDSLQLKPPFVLITSAIHMKRSENVFKKTNIDYISFPCDYKVNEENFSFDEYLIPNISLLNKWSFLLKEIVGLYVYKLTGKA